MRLNAFHVLRRHGGPEHYDQVALFLEVPTTSQRAEVVETMAALDEQRLAGELITWVDEGLHADQHKAAVPLVMQGATAEQANALWARRESLDPELISTLNAMAARHGNEEALDLLRVKLPAYMIPKQVPQVLAKILFKSERILLDSQFSLF